MPGALPSFAGLARAGGFCLLRHSPFAEIPPQGGPLHFKSVRKLGIKKKVSALRSVSADFTLPMGRAACLVTRRSPRRFAPSWEGGHTRPAHRSGICRIYIRPSLPPHPREPGHQMSQYIFALRCSSGGRAFQYPVGRVRSADNTPPHPPTPSPPLRGRGGGLGLKKFCTAKF